MFEKKEKNLAPPPEPIDDGRSRRTGVMSMLRAEEAPPSRGTGELNALIGAGSEFEGKLRFTGTVRIDGKFKGEISSEDILVIGEDAEIDGDVSVGTALVHGKVKGTIRARELIELHKPCRFFGNLVTPSLVIERGVIFEGNTKMENPGAPPAAKPVAAPGKPEAK